MFIVIGILRGLPLASGVIPADTPTIPPHGIKVTHGNNTRMLLVMEQLVIQFFYCHAKCLICHEISACPALTNHAKWGINKSWGTHTFRHSAHTFSGYYILRATQLPEFTFRYWLARNFMPIVFPLHGTNSLLQNEVAQVRRPWLTHTRDTARP